MHWVGCRCFAAEVSVPLSGMWALKSGVAGTSITACHTRTPRRNLISELPPWSLDSLTLPWTAWPGRDWQPGASLRPRQPRHGGRNPLIHCFVIISADFPLTHRGLTGWKAIKATRGLTAQNNSKSRELRANPQLHFRVCEGERDVNSISGTTRLSDHNGEIARDSLPAPTFHERL